MTKLPTTRVFLLAKLCSVLGFLGLGAFAQDWEIIGPFENIEDIIFDDDNTIWAGGGREHRRSPY